MTKRKTIPVEDLVKEINRRNRLSTCSPDKRDGWNCMLEHILHATNNYKGFGYLLSNDVPEGHAPGIKEFRGNYPKGLEQDNSDAFEGCDETRRRYNV